MRTGNSSEIQLKFDVPNSEIDSHTFVESLIGITTIIQEANRQLDPDRRINVRVKALGEGSFIAYLDLIQTDIIGIIKHLFSLEGLTYEASLATITGLVLQARSMVKQKKK